MTERIDTQPEANAAAEQEHVQAEINETEALERELNQMMKGQFVFKPSPKSEAQEDVKNEQEVVEGPENKQTSSEASETPENEQNAEQHDAAPLTDRLASFEQKYVKPEEEKLDVKKQYQAFETQVKSLENQLLSYDFNATLPKGGYFEKNGKSIFEMTNPELNDYIVELQDRGQAFAAGQIQTEYMKALDRARGYETEWNKLQKQKGQLEQYRHYVEWQELRQELTKNFPELEQKDFESIGNYIDEQAKTDSTYAASLNTLQQKIDKGVAAMLKLGIIARLKEQAGQSENKTVVAPDAGVTNKRVKQVSTGKPTHKLSSVLSKSTAELSKELSEEDWDALLRGDYIDDIN